MEPDNRFSDHWSHLPDDLLELITSRLCCFQDLIRLSCVCRSWKSFSTTKSSTLLSPKLHLWFIVPDESVSSGVKNLSLQNFYDDCVYRIPTSELEAYRICGSSFGGWLVTTNDNGNIQVFRPFTKTLIRLPHVSKFPGVQMTIVKEDDFEGFLLDFPPDDTPDICKYSDYYPTYVWDFFLYKIILSSDASIAMAIHGVSRRLGFCRIGIDESWSALNVQEKDIYGFQDVVFYRGRFYAVRSSGAVYAVLGLDTDTPFIKLVIYSPQFYEEDEEYDSEEYHVKYYLVESLQGELMLVKRVRFFPPFCQFFEREYETIVFRVAKLDMDAHKSVRVKDFGSDSSFFVGVNHSFSVSNSDLPCPFNGKNNHIFFTDDYLEGYELNAYGYDFGYFDHKRCRVRIWSWGSKNRIQPHPVWLTTIIST